MPRYKITIEYDGTNYCGWQKQPQQKTIESVITNALKTAFKKNIEIFGSGRTDAGVHATGQVAHFDYDKKLSNFEMIMAINHNIDHNENITIIDCQEVAADFHSRFDAKMRFYEYKIINRTSKLALQKNRAWHVAPSLDLQKMQEASKLFIGTHNFSSFKDSECQTRNPIRTINDIKITKNNDLILFQVSAKSFLHHMVRNIVGTLYLVGKNKLKAQDIKEILDAKDRTKSGPNAPACGLYFVKVEY